MTTIAVALAAAYACLLSAKAWLAIRAARRCPSASTPSASDEARVTIAQAILSGDPRLAATLEDNVRALPSARFLFLVDEDDPDAHAIGRDIAARHAATRIDILVSPPPPDGVNPKLFKLDRIRPLLGDEVLLVLDDDTRMPPASLGALLSGLRDHALVTGLPGYLDDGRWPSRLLAAFVNNNAALTYLPMLAFGPPVTINGMAYALRGDTLARLGGFATIRHALTDDLAVARAVMEGGGRIAQTASPHWVETSVADGAHYLRLMQRWLLFGRLLLRRQPLAGQLAIVVLCALPSLLLLGLLVLALWSTSLTALAALAIVLAGRAVLLAGLQRRIYGRSLHRPLWSILSELLQPLHLAHACVTRTIVWRTRRYRVTSDESFEAVP